MNVIYYKDNLPKKLLNYPSKKLIKVRNLQQAILINKNKKLYYFSSKITDNDIQIIKNNNNIKFTINNKDKDTIISSYKKK